MPPKYKSKRDASEKAIIQELDAHGISVFQLFQPVDLLCGFRGQTFLVEVKSGNKGYGKGLNENQQKFADGWNGGKIIMLHSEIDARDWAIELRSEKQFGGME